MIRLLSERMNSKKASLTATPAAHSPVATFAQNSLSFMRIMSQKLSIKFYRIKLMKILTKKTWMNMLHLRFKSRENCKKHTQTESSIRRTLSASLKILIKKATHELVRVLKT